MIINSDENDFSNTDHFRNEAQELLNAVEAKSKINFLHHGYDNPALQLDDNLSLDSKKQSDCSLNLNSQILSTKTINSSFVKQVIYLINYLFRILYTLVFWLIFKLGLNLNFNINDS